MKMYEKIKSMYKAIKNKATEVALVGALTGMALLPGCGEGSRTEKPRFYDPDFVVSNVIRDLNRAERNQRIERNRKRMAEASARQYFSEARALFDYLGFSPEQIREHAKTSKESPQPTDDLVWEGILRESKAQNRETWPVPVSNDIGDLVCKETESENN